MLSNHEVSLASNPIDLNVRRSRISQHKTVSDTFSSGELVPIYWKAVLPGTTIQMKVNSFIRMNTPLHPVMDVAEVDITAFSIPLRLCWIHWVNLRGENSNTFWETPSEYDVPQITSPTGGWNVGTVADHLGFAPGVAGYSVSHLPFRAYCLVWNDWWRSESISQPVSIDIGDNDVTGENATLTDYITKGTLGGACLPVARFHDVFSSALPEPQAGEAVVIPTTTFASNFFVPVAAHHIDHDTVFKDYITGKWSYSASHTDGYEPLNFLKVGSNSKWEAIDTKANVVVSNSGKLNTDGSSGTTLASAITPNNLFADLNGISAGVGIALNDLRKAAAVQQVMEGLNRGGTRYKELLESMFGVRSPDARLQRPELIGVRRFPLQVQQINQTSSTDNTSPLGTPGADSKTIDFDNVLFQHSFVEDSLVMIFACVRPHRTYCQGVPPWSRKRTRYDFFYPTMQGLGDMPVPNSQIYIQSDSTVDADGNIINDLPFAYQQAWYSEFTDYNEARGLFRPQVTGTLASWNYADLYNSLPVLSHSWLYDKGNIARTIAVQSQPEFNAQFQFDSIWTLPVEIGRAPGLHTI